MLCGLQKDVIPAALYLRKKSVILLIFCVILLLSSSVYSELLKIEHFLIKKTTGLHHKSHQIITFRLGGPLKNPYWCKCVGNFAHTFGSYCVNGKKIRFSERNISAFFPNAVFPFPFHMNGMKSLSVCLLNVLTQCRHWQSAVLLNIPSAPCRAQWSLFCFWAVARWPDGFSEPKSALSIRHLEHSENEISPRL